MTALRNFFRRPSHADELRRLTRERHDEIIRGLEARNKRIKSAGLLTQSHLDDVAAAKRNRDMFLASIVG